MEQGPEVRFGDRTLTLARWPKVGEALRVMDAVQAASTGDTKAIGALVATLATALDQPVEAVEALEFHQLEECVADFLAKVRRPATPHP